MALFLLVASHAWAAGFSDKARWITASHPNINNPNTWIAFRKDVHVDKVKGEVLASIAADSKNRPRRRTDRCVCVEYDF